MKITEKSYSLLVWVTLGIGAFFIGSLFYDHFSHQGPGDRAYIAGNNFFKTADYSHAVQSYTKALTENPNHIASLRALANSYVQLKAYGKALVQINRAIELTPDFAGGYAIRGIIHDHQRHYDLAMKDYQRALLMDSDLLDGMSWIDRVLYNVQETPATIEVRLSYLKAQMALPESQRLLRVPELDDKQRAYEK